MSDETMHIRFTHDELAFRTLSKMELSRLDTAFRLLRALAEIEPVYESFTGDVRCMYCSGDNREHDEVCPWNDSKKLLASLDRATPHGGLPLEPFVTLPTEGETGAQ